MENIRKKDSRLVKVEKSPLEIIIDAVPNSKKEDKNIQAAIVAVRQISSYSGPIPPPDALREYDDILPGAADRILSMAEKQSNHRMELEKEVIRGQVKNSNRGQIFGFIIFFICIGIAFVFARYLEMKTFAAYFLSATMLFLVSLFVTGKVHILKDLQKKRNGE